MPTASNKQAANNTNHLLLIHFTSFLLIVWP